jgi:hypothetical protein
MPDLTREELAALIRAVWVEEYRAHRQRATGRPSGYTPGPSWDGGRDASGRDHKPLWPRVADFVIRNEVTDPAAFVRAQFPPGLTRPPYPNLLTTAQALLNYREFRPRLVEGLRLALASQAHEFRRKAASACTLYGRSRRALEHVLGDANAGLSALFRFAVARREGLEDECRVWLPLARAQYLSAPSDYDEVWGDVIPEEVKRPLGEEALHGRT